MSENIKKYRSQMNTTVVRVPNELLDDIRAYIAHYRSIGKYKLDVKKVMKDFKNSTGCLDAEVTASRISGE